MSVSFGLAAVEIAERIARRAHAHQVDKAGQPYVGHLERVVRNLVRRWSDVTADELSAAWLHDVMEDTEWDADMLRRAGIPASTIQIVEELTRPPRFAYQAWIHSLAALGSRSALRVKLADNEDNSDPDRVAAVPDGQAMLEARYRPARILLEKGLSRGW